jgi:HEAT repeat protein
MSALSDASQQLLDVVLEGRTISIRRDAIDKLLNLPDVDKVVDYLEKRLDREESGYQRGWIVSALATLNKPKKVIERLHNDDDHWVRYWAAIGLAKLKPDDLNEHLHKALDADFNELVKAVILRLLIDIEPELANDYINELIKMLNDRNWWSRLSACKVLRFGVGQKLLRKSIENEFIKELDKILSEEHELIDVKRQAALALGNLTNYSEDAIDVLSKTMKNELDEWTRRSCVDALTQIAHAKKGGAPNALLPALLDPDAEIRVRAANALEISLGKPGAVKYIIEEILKHENLNELYFNALRKIQREEAARLFTNYLLHPDPSISNLASNALTILGGEEAVRTLQAQRTKAMDTYTEILDDADSQIMMQYNRIIERARHAFSLSLVMHAVIFGVGLIILILSLNVALSEGYEVLERYIGLGAAGGSLATLLAMFYKDPLKNIRESVTSLIKVNVIFLGFVRQINQIDATFKQLFLEPQGLQIDKMTKTVKQIQETVNQTMNEIEENLTK